MTKTHIAVTVAFFAGSETVALETVFESRLNGSREVSALIVSYEAAAEEASLPPRHSVDLHAGYSPLNSAESCLLLNLADYFEWLSPYGLQSLGLCCSASQRGRTSCGGRVFLFV